MKDILKKVDWKKVRLNAIKIVFTLILNTPLWVFLIGNFVPYAKLGEFRLSWIDYLRLSDKVEWYQIWFLYIAIAIGVLLTIWFIKWWLSAIKQEKDKQEMLKANENNTKAIIEAITKEKAKEQKKLEKEEKEIRKYLGE